MSNTYSIISFPSSQLPEQYVNLIYSRWLRSFKIGNHFLRKLKKEKLRAYYSDYRKHIENLLAKPDSVIRLAVLSDDKDVVLGFSISREDVLDYVHVQTDNRRLGIAKMLVPNKVTTVSHMTNLATGIWQENPNYKHIKFNPYA